MRFGVVLISVILAGCGSHTPVSKQYVAVPAVVTDKLQVQLRQWQGTPYRHGGIDKRGVDCSGFVYLTFRDHFNIQLPRTTAAQTELGTEIARNELMPGDLVFFKTGRGSSGLHVGIYHTNDKFIHVSTSRGVTRSSLQNVYWKKVYWQARRI